MRWSQEIVGIMAPSSRQTKGTTHGGIASPMLFNVGVDIVLRHWLFITVEDVAVIQDGMGYTVGWILGVFYVDNGLLGLRDLEWLQVTLNVFI